MPNGISGGLTWTAHEVGLTMMMIQWGDKKGIERRSLVLIISLWRRRLQGDLLELGFRGTGLRLQGDL